MNSMHDIDDFQPVSYIHQFINMWVDIPNLHFHPACSFTLELFWTSTHLMPYVPEAMSVQIIPN